MTDIATWLGQQLDEDEQSAHDARHDLDGVWTCVERSDRSLKVTDSLGYSIAEDEEADSAPWWTLPHIARHDPARVLRVVATLRAILAEHPMVYRDLGWLENGEERSAELPVCGHCVPKNSHYRKPEDVPRGACRTVRAVAAIYDDRPGFKDEWRL